MRQSELDRRFDRLRNLLGDYGRGAISLRALVEGMEVELAAIRRHREFQVEALREACRDLGSACAGDGAITPEVILALGRCVELTES